MDGSLKILLSLLRDLVNIGLVKLSFFLLSLLFVYGCDVALTGPRTSLSYFLKWRLFLEPPVRRSAQFSTCPSKQNTIDWHFRTVYVPLWYPTIGMKNSCLLQGICRLPCRSDCNIITSLLVKKTVTT